MKEQTVSITKKDLLKAYNKADKGQKALLSNLFSKESLSTSIFDRVTDLESACDELGLDMDTIFHDNYDAYDRARKTLEIFAEALREGKPASESLYYPYFDRSGGGFRYFAFVHVSDYTYVGARLRVDTSEKAVFFGKQLLDMWKVYING